MYRPGRMYSMISSDGSTDAGVSNLLRIAEIWMDDYKRLFYLQRPDQLVLLLYLNDYQLKFQ